METVIKPELVYVNIADLIDPSNGKTYRENNLATKHRIAVGSLVEVKDGSSKHLRLYVASQTRDCDGTPLYSLSFDRKAGREWEEFQREFENLTVKTGLDLWQKGLLQGKLDGGYCEDSLLVLLEPKDLPPEDD